MLNPYISTNALLAIKLMSFCYSGSRVSESQQHGVLDGRHLHPGLRRPSQTERGHSSPGQGLQTARTRRHCRGSHSHRRYSHLHCGIMKIPSEEAHSVAGLDCTNLQQLQYRLHAVSQMFAAGRRRQQEPVYKPSACRILL